MPGTSMENVVRLLCYVGERRWYSLSQPEWSSAFLMQTSWLAPAAIALRQAADGRSSFLCLSLLAGPVPVMAPVQSTRLGTPVAPARRSSLYGSFRHGHPDSTHSQETRVVTNGFHEYWDRISALAISHISVQKRHPAGSCLSHMFHVEIYTALSEMQRS
jgi:hypothetical protein